MICSRSQLSENALEAMIFGHITNWGSVEYNGLRLDIAYRAGCFDETVFAIAFDRAQKRVAKENGS